MSEPHIVVEDVWKQFVTGDAQIDVLKDVSFGIERGEFVCIVGSSGAGKTTLLNILGTLLRPSSGKVSFSGKDLFQLSDRALSIFRNKHIGFVFQYHHLLPEFSAQENVAMPLLIRRVPPAEALNRAAALLEKVGLGHRIGHRPGELSFGEQQRVAVARALVGEPDIVLADEPTGNLDRETGEQVFSLLLELTIKKDRTLVVVTHNLRLTSQASKVLRILDGRCAPPST